MSGTTAEVYVPPRPAPDDKVIELSKEAVPNMDEEARHAASELGTSPLPAITKMLELSGHVRYGLGYKVALGDTGVVPKLVDLLRGDDASLATEAANLIYSLCRVESNAEIALNGGAVPLLVAMFEKNPEFNVVMGGPAAGALKRIAMHRVEWESVVVKANGMEALLTGLRNYKKGDDIEDPASRLRDEITKRIAAYEDSL